jgi:uncharacterized protein YndB with AHSA1/START domain
MTETTTETFKLQIKKIFKTNRAKVFAAWTDLKVFQQWFGPAHMGTEVVSLDAKVGGNYQVNLLPKDDKTTPELLTGTYIKIIPNELLVFSFKGTWQGDVPATLVTLEFKDVGDGTELILTQEGFVTSESRDNHNQGWNVGLDKLSKLLNS